MYPVGLSSHSPGTTHSSVAMNSKEHKKTLCKHTNNDTLLLTSAESQNGIPHPTETLMQNIPSL